MRNVYPLLLVVLTSGCVTVRYNGADKVQSKVDYPPIGAQVTVFMGDALVKKGAIVEETYLVVNSSIDGALYDVPAGAYKQIGFDEKAGFFSAAGVVRGVLSDPVQALSLDKGTGSKLCVVSTFGQAYCYEGDFQMKNKLSEVGDSFQQTLIYSGRVGDKINVSYREFSSSLARPAFNNDVEYDLSISRVIGYKGAQIEVIGADNNSITYKLIRNFP